MPILAEYLKEVDSNALARHLQGRTQAELSWINDYTVEHLGGESAAHYLLTNPITQERGVVVVHPLTDDTAHIELQPYCGQGNLLEYGKNNDLPAVTEKMIQLTDILIRLGENNQRVTDLNPTHCLITDTGEVVMQSGGHHALPGIALNESMEPILSHHAMQLGRALYLTVSQQPINVLANNQGQLSFTHSLFKTQEGKQMQKIIEGLMQTDPNKRLSLQTAKQQLMAIGHETSTYRQLLSERRSSTSQPLRKPADTPPLTPGHRRS